MVGCSQSVECLSIGSIMGEMMNFVEVCEMGMRSCMMSSSMVHMSLMGVLFLMMSLQPDSSMIVNGVVVVKCPGLVVICCFNSAVVRPPI